MLSAVDLILEDIENKDYKSLIKFIDESIRKFQGWYPWECAIIHEELSYDIREEISEMYKEAGWKYVSHKVSSENGEKAGLTSFKFSMVPLDYQ